jgi:hypothetical protein
MANAPRSVASRRDILRGGIAAAAGLAAAASHAQSKTSKTDARYQAGPRNGMSCAQCSLFRPPRACAVVIGDIAPEGWCRFFDLPD